MLGNTHGACAISDPDNIYLDHAATSWPKPEAVGEAMADFLRTSGGNAGRGGHRLAREAGDVVEQARFKLAQLLGVETRRMVLTGGCTQAINMAVDGVMGALGQRKGEGKGRYRDANSPPNIVVSAMEHNAVLRSVYTHQRQQGVNDVVEVRIAQADANGLITPEAVANVADEQTVLVCVAHASNVTGTVQPIREIAEAVAGASDERALFFVDAAQTVGVIDAQPEELGADLLAYGTHKGLMGPTGLGGLYVGERVWPDVNSSKGALFVGTVRGGTGDSRDQHMPTSLPEALEAGTPNAMACAGLMAAMAWARNVRPAPPPQPSPEGGGSQKAALNCAESMDRQPPPPGRGQGEGAGVVSNKSIKELLPQNLLDLARELRSDQTPPEAILWSLLRRKQLSGYRFRRQHPIYPYVLDFYCCEAQLAVELDGLHHEQHQEHDKARDRKLRKQGIHTLRFSVSEFTKNTEAVLRKILSVCQDRTSAPPPQPSPEGGGSQKAALNSGSCALRLTDTIRAWAGQTPGVHAPGPTSDLRRVPVVTLYFGGAAPDEVAAILEEHYAILTRAGLHCAPLAHEAVAPENLKQAGGVRISPGPELTEEQAGKVLEVLTEVVGELRAS